MIRFTESLENTLEYEGGFVDDPDDSGGATNFGVTQKVYDEFREGEGVPKRTVRDIERRELEKIYFVRYWVAGKCPDLPPPIAMAHFDACVHHGEYWGKRILQRGAGVEDDAKIGPITLAAINSMPRSELINNMLWERLRYMTRIARNRPKDLKFLVGWNFRVLALRGKLIQGGASNDG
jgi:lysozyme family protein